MSQHFLALGTLGAFWGPSWASQSISHYFSGPVLKFTQRAPFFFATTSWAVLEHSWALIGPGPFRNPFLRPSWSLSRGPRSISQKFFGPSWSILWPSWAPQSISHYFSGPVLEFIQGAPVQCRNSFFFGPLGAFLGFYCPPGQFRITFLGQSWSVFIRRGPGQFRNIFWRPSWSILGPSWAPRSISHSFSGPVLEFTQRAPGQFRNTYLGLS